MVLAFSHTAASAVYANEGQRDYSHLYADQYAQKVFVQEKITEFFPTTYRTMLAIASCESTGLIHWLPDGTLRPHDAGASSAAGVFQVLLGLHRDEIQSLGLDMSNPDDYFTFVRHLHDRNSNPFSDWNASRHCWQTRLAQK